MTVMVNSIDIFSNRWRCKYILQEVSLNFSVFSYVPQRIMMDRDSQTAGSYTTSTAAQAVVQGRSMGAQTVSVARDNGAQTYEHEFQP